MSRCIIRNYVRPQKVIVQRIDNTGQASHDATDRRFRPLLDRNYIYYAGVYLKTCRRQARGILNANYGILQKSCGFRVYYFHEITTTTLDQNFSNNKGNYFRFYQKQ